MAGMRILIVGGGGREHALAWKISRDSCRPELFCAPGNAGTARLAENLMIPASDLDSLVVWAREARPDLTVIGPEAPLCAGLADRLLAAGLRVFGPRRAAARLEGSKAFAKEIMEKAGVPTARAERFTDAGDALSYIRSQPGRAVVKADGLAAGKGVTVCDTRAEAEKAVEDALINRAFGEAGREVLIEERLEGEEVSVLALTDGRHTEMLASAQDHKRVGDDDTGPNTGGMGAYSPAPVLTPAQWQAVRSDVFERTLTELSRRGIIYRGVLYAGLMLTVDGPKVLEFNCRFGDPETQAILPRWQGDILPALMACADGTLDRIKLEWTPDACVCVVMAAGGYPGPYDTDVPIAGLEEASARDGVVVFHAGTRLSGGQTVTAGGRVLGVTAWGADLRAARARAYGAAELIRFDRAHYRRDIGARGLAR